MLVKALEHCKDDGLTRALCQSQSKIDVFDHFFIVKVAEIFWRGSPHLALHPPSVPSC